MRIWVTALLFFLYLTAFNSFGQKTDSTKNTSFAIYPAFGYQPETKAQFGAIAIWVLSKNANLDTAFSRPSSISPFLLYTVRGQIISAVDFEFFFKSGLNLNAVARYFNFPDNFYGIGNDRNPDEVENYTNNFNQYTGELYKPLNPRVFVGLTFEIQYNWLRDFEPGGELETGDFNGKEGGLIVGLGPAFKIDTRNNTIYPTKGALLTSAIRVNSIGDFAFTSYTLDARKFLTIKNEKNVIGFQFNTSLTSGSNVPFYKLPQLGGDERLRGIENASLYRDKQSFYLQTEYRRDLFWRFGAVAFAGIGDVASKLSDLTPSEFKYVAGFGGRFQAVRDEKLNIRVDIGFARGGQRAIYIGLREVF